MTLTRQIDEFKKRYGNAGVEHFRVIKNGKVIGDTVGNEKSVQTWNNVKNCDVIHNHPTGNPAFSPMDIIMTMYGNANSVTSVSSTRGSWTMTRPAVGWKFIDHRVIESEYKKALSKEKKSDATVRLVADIRAKNISMVDGEGIFAERYSAVALDKLGLRIIKR